MSILSAIAQLLSVGGDYQISRSVRLRSSATAYFNRTFAGAPTSTTKHTYSAWVKRGSLANLRTSLFSGYDGSSTNNFAITFESSGTLQDSFCVAFGGSTANYVQTNALLRDPSAWYHLGVSIDTTQATAANRVILYVNGVQQTSLYASSYPAQNAAIQFALANANNRVGAWWNSSLSFDGYLTEINFIDGQALTASSFGEFDGATGVWKPKRYSGTYGTNGFYLNFADNSAATAAAIGKDSSGNGNNWTPNNISVTAGATYDSMIDTPTPYVDGGNGRGNYAVWNPLSSNVYNTATDGNLRMDVVNLRACLSSIAMSSGKWYCEISMGKVPAIIGIADATYTFLASGTNSVFNLARSYGYISTGNKQTAGTITSYGASWAAGDIIGIAYDADAGSLTFYKNGVSQGVAFTGITVPVVFVAFGGYGTVAGTFAYLNAGQRPFIYTPPTGFKALNTQNLPDSTIKKGNQYFDATTYTGNGSSLTVTNAGSFQPDLVWMKKRSAVGDHVLVDSVRGAGKGLFSNLTNAENASMGGFLSFDSGGWSMNGTISEINASGASHVGWQWKKGATQGFDIVTYASGASGDKSIPHSLGVAPKMIITKSRDSASFAWSVYHASVTSNLQWLRLNTTDAIVSNGTNCWGTGHTSTTFGITSGNGVVANTNCVAYLFAEVAGFSKFGSYTGNGSADGPFVYCGFRPKFVLFKRTDSISQWSIEDASRSQYNAVTAKVWADSSEAEASSSNYSVDFLSNGFKIRTSATDLNTSGGTVIFAAFAENPFKNSLAR